MLNEQLTSADVNNFRRWGPGSIRVPPVMSRHEIVISLMFRLFSEPALQSVGILLVSGTLSLIFVLFVFRRLLITMLNPSFWAQIRVFELGEVLLRALRFVSNLRFYRPFSTSTGTGFTTSTGFLDQARLAVTRVSEIIRLGQIDYQNARNSGATILTAGFEAYLRGQRRQSFWPFLFSVGSLSSIVVFLFRNHGSLRELLDYLSRLGSGSIQAPASGREIIPEIPTLIPEVSRDLVAFAARFLEVFTDFFMDYF